MFSRYVPTIGDVEKYTSYKGPVTELHIVDQYMKEVGLQQRHVSTKSLTDTEVLLKH